MVKKKKVIMAMSGGVDSSTSAYMLKEQGYEVIGIHLRLWFDEDDDIDSKVCDEGKRCCALSNADDARDVAGQVGIPFYVLNCRAHFHRYVVDYFCNEYLCGRTPNPCIICNHIIKFGYLIQKADELEADYVATGHYAITEFDEARNRYLLKKGVDPKKEQSYFLFSLNQKQLSRALFPLGGYTKEQVREIAKKAGLQIHSKSESQEICFITNNNYRDFLEKRFPERFKPGEIVTTEGKAIGEHKGICSYTIGQRKGIGISHPTPLYVVGIDVEKNEVIIGEDTDLLKNELTIENPNWIAIESLKEPLRVQTKIRYNHPGTPSTIEPLEGDNGKTRILLDEPQRAITPGQAAVFYDNDIVIGGGWILQ